MTKRTLDEMDLELQSLQVACGEWNQTGCENHDDEKVV
jgi:hypothetical protein